MEIEVRRAELIARRSALLDAVNEQAPERLRVTGLLHDQFGPAPPEELGSELSAWEDERAAVRAELDGPFFLPLTDDMDGRSERMEAQAAEFDVDDEIDRLKRSGFTALLADPHTWWRRQQEGFERRGRFLDEQARSARGTMTVWRNSPEMALDGMGVVLDDCGERIARLSDRLAEIATAVDAAIIHRLDALEREPLARRSVRDKRARLTQVLGEAGQVASELRRAAQELDVELDESHERLMSAYRVVCNRRDYSTELQALDPERAMVAHRAALEFEPQWLEERSEDERERIARAIGEAREVQRHITEARENEAIFLHRIDGLLENLLFEAGAIRSGLEDALPYYPRSEDDGE